MAIYSVSQVSRYLRDILEQDPFLRDVWVSGEVMNLARPGSGHSYFALTEARASLRCAMFKGGVGAELLSDGAAVIAHGRTSIYEARGDLQLIVDIVQPEGVGELQLKLEQLRLKLEAEGLFDPMRKRALPEFPQRVGVITSPTGAVWHDIRQVLGRRYPLVELLLASTPVQGETAVPGLVDAFRAMNETPDVDLVILARGGGSFEDLWPFNEEMVARAIYASRAPVISAVGHETDLTIADMVADQRAPTPSAAAEMAVPDRQELASRVRGLSHALTAATNGHVTDKLDILDQASDRLRRARPDLDMMRQRVDDLLNMASLHLKHGMAVQRSQAAALLDRLEALSPAGTLKRGYAIVQTPASDAVVTRADLVGTGDPVEVTLGRGGFGAEVTSVRSGDGPPRRKERRAVEGKPVPASDQCPE